MLSQLIKYNLIFIKFQRQSESALLCVINTEQPPGSKSFKEIWCEPNSH